MEVLLVTTMKSGKWTFPKGNVRRKHRANKAALKFSTNFELRRIEASAAVAECVEEAGVLGVTWHPHSNDDEYEPLARFEYTHGDGANKPRDVAVHAVRVSQTFEPDDPRWPDDSEGSRSVRVRAWIPLNLAIVQVYASLSQRDAQEAARLYPDAAEVQLSGPVDPRPGMALARAARQLGVYAALVAIRAHLADAGTNGWAVRR